MRTAPWAFRIADAQRGCQGVRGVPLGMTRMDPHDRDPDPSDGWAAALVLVREEPDEEEDEEDDGEEDDDDAKEDGDGYSE